MNRQMQIIGLLLAAGRGRRFDPAGQQDKLLQALPGGASVAASGARTLCAALPQVLAVLRPAAPQLAQCLSGEGAHISVCEQADAGMAISLVHALHQAEQRWPQADGWLVALADMPFVQPATLQALLAAAQASAPDQIIAPVFAGQRGHPVLFKRAHLPDLLALQGDKGASSLFANWPCHALELLDAGVLQDIDTPAQLKNRV
jgi:molybdenum cofactor cytidylyltransferase